MVINTFFTLIIHGYISIDISVLNMQFIITQ